MTNDSTDLPPFHTGELRWRKSRFSGESNCVTVADGGDRIAVRHSRSPDGAVLLLTRNEMAEWLDRIKAGELDHLASPPV